MSRMQRHSAAWHTGNRYQATRIASGKGMSTVTKGSRWSARNPESPGSSGRPPGRSPQRLTLPVARLALERSH